MIKAREILIPAIEQLHSTGLTTLRLRFTLSYLQFLLGIQMLERESPPPLEQIMEFLQGCNSLYFTWSGTLLTCL